MCTITGSSGVGKTTIVKRLQVLRPDLRLITSHTSRSARDSDIPGEYNCNISQEDFVKNKEDYLWVVVAHGNYYGTTKRSVEDVFVSEASLNSPLLMIIVPESVALLRQYLEFMGVDESQILSFYVLAPNEEELRRRLVARGDDALSIERRVSDCKEWDKIALTSDIPYIFLSNNDSMMGVEPVVRQMSMFF
ncbi:MAG: hypothetical protein HY225_03225 [Candidatus Vogelbacteria bacterium]|nr:hypothetical protein [Candidatus Vogelbacteria bacterium]